MKNLFFAAIAALVLTSCSKTEVKEVLNNISVTIGFQVAGVWVELGVNNGGGYYYDQQYYGSYVYGNNINTETTICYVLTKPYNSELIPVFDKYNRQIGTARCDMGVGSQTNQLWLSLQNWFDIPPGGKCAVLVSWPVTPFTHNGPWTGTIIAKQK